MKTRNPISIATLVLLSTFLTAGLSQAQDEYTFVSTWGTYGTENGQFSSPTDVALDANNDLYVADRFNHRIQKFDDEGNFISSFGSNGTGDGQFDLPRGIAIDASGYIYVADAANHRIQKFNSNGGFVTKWGSHGTGDGQFSSPTGIAVDSNNHVYVVEWGNHRIQKFSSDGTFLAKWGSYCFYSSGTKSGCVDPDGSGPLELGDGQFMYPYAVAVGATDEVYVADYYNHRVQKFDGSGNFITKWGDWNVFRYPSGITVGPDGYVYVVGRHSYNVGKFTSDGTHITTWGGYGIADGQFRYPNGLEVDGSHYVYVADTENHRIQKFEPACIDSIEALEALILEVESMELPEGIETSLVAKLDVAKTQLEREQVPDLLNVINLVEAFANEVFAQRGRVLSVEQADGLVDDVRLFLQCLRP